MIMHAPLTRLDPHAPASRSRLLAIASRLNDPPRFSSLLQSGCCEAVYYGEQQQGKEHVAILRTGHPASTSYSVFVSTPHPTWPVPPFEGGEAHTRSDSPSAELDDDGPVQQALWCWVAAALAHQIKPAPDVLLSAVPRAAVAPIKEALLGANYRLTYDEECHRLTLPGGRLAPQALQLLGPAHPATVIAPLASDPNTRCQHRVHVGPLKLQDAEVVNDKWTYKSATSLDLVRAIIANRATMGVRLSACQDGAEQDSPCKDTLVAWALHGMDGSVGKAHTLKEYRQLGLMSVCLAHLLHDVSAVQPEVVHACVVTSNAPSLAMMLKLGARVCGPGCHWLGFSLSAPRL